MARTKVTARKNLGGKAPRKMPAPMYGKNYSLCIFERTYY